VRSRVERALRGLAVGIVAAVGAATLLGLLDRFFWFFVVVDVFRLQYAVVLAVAAIAAAGLRRFRLAALGAALVAVNVVVLALPFPTSATPVPPGAKRALRLLIANVETGNTHYAEIAQLVERTHPDVVGLVELTPAIAAHLEQALPAYKVRRLAPRTDAYGIGVFSRLPLRATVEHNPADAPAVVVARLRVHGKALTLVVVHIHTPFAGSVYHRQLDALARERPRFGGRVAICGDFNTPPWAGPFRHLAETAELAELYGRRAWSGYSWPTWSRLLRVPLDNCLLAPGIAVVRHEEGSRIGSDHFPLIVDLAIA
jgi:endonuclease/exonuclease/phosphatase (EEP) superfamily protein YafD